MSEVIQAQQNKRGRKSKWAKLAHRIHSIDEFGRVFVCSFAPEDSQIRIPWERFSFPYDSSYYCLRELQTQLPRLDQITNRQQLERLEQRFLALGQDALHFWRACHWVILLDGTPGYKLPFPADGQVTSEALGCLFYELLNMSIQVYAHTPGTDHTYLTAETLWTRCLQERWAITSSQIIGKAATARPSKTKAAKLWGTFRKALKDPQTDLSGWIDSTRLSDSYDLHMAAKKLAKEPRFKEQYFDPLLKAYEGIEGDIKSSLTYFIHSADQKLRCGTGRGKGSVAFNPTREDSAIMELLKDIYGDLAP